MNGGADQAMPRLCKQDGCDSPVRARSLCSRHYQRVQKSGGYFPSPALTHKSILECLPGRELEIMQQCQVDRSTVRRHMKLAREAGDAHISHFAPPDETGYKWQAVWVAGPGKDAVLTKAMRNRYRQDRQNFNRARRRERELMRSAPPASWMGPLGIVPAHREDQHG